MMGQGSIFIFLSFILWTQSLYATSPLEKQSFICADLVSKRSFSKTYKESFVTTFRGQPLKVSFITNRKRLLKSKDLIVVIPGLNKGSFEEMVEVIGERGEQAISLDLININGTGPFEAPTPEEDAELLYALLEHLGFTKKHFRKKLLFVNHSRGTLVSSRFVRAYHENYRFAGIIQFNPYVGWIPDYYAQLHGKALSSGFRMIHTLWGWVPGVGVAAGITASLLEEAGTKWALSTFKMYMNIHDQRMVHKILSEELGVDDSEVLEGLRQKLIGMEHAEIMQDFQQIQELGIPMLIVRSDNDQLVPAGQIESVAGHFGFPVLVSRGSDHYLPYLKTSEAADVVMQALLNLQKNRPIESGIVTY